MFWQVFSLGNQHSNAGTPLAGAPAATHWRLAETDAYNSNYLAASEVAFVDVNGTRIAHTDVNGYSNEASYLSNTVDHDATALANWLDDNTGTGRDVGVKSNYYLVFEFTQAITPSAIRIAANTSFPEDTIAYFKVEYSTDSGSTWTTYQTFDTRASNGGSAWSASEQRESELPCFGYIADGMGRGYSSSTYNVKGNLLNVVSSFYLTEMRYYQNINNLSGNMIICTVNPNDANRVLSVDFRGAISPTLSVNGGYGVVSVPNLLIPASTKILMAVEITSGGTTTNAGVDYFTSPTLEYEAKLQPVVTLDRGYRNRVMEVVAGTAQISTGDPWCLDFKGFV